MKAEFSASSQDWANSPALSLAPQSLVALPSLVRARGGAEFDPREDRWSWRDSLSTVSLDFEPFRDLLTPQLVAALKATLVWYAEVHSPNTLSTSRWQMLHFLRTVVSEGAPPLREIRGVDLLNYRAALSGDNVYYLGRIGSILRRWGRLGFPGVQDALSLLDDMRIGGAAKGAPVMTMCPLIGPFTNLEQEAIQAAVDEAFTDGTIEEGHYLLTWLFLALGQRPIQYAALKVCDLSQTTSADGSQIFMLKVPRAKQHENPRTSFKERHLIPQIGRPLWNYVQRIRKQYSVLLPDSEQAPMFPQKRPGALAHGFEYHYTAGSLSMALRQVLAKLNVLSERTGDWHTSSSSRPASMAEPFLSFAKSYVRYQHGARRSKAIAGRLAALRALEAALIEHGLDANPVACQPDVLNRAAQLLKERYAAAVAYRYGSQLQLVAEFLNKHGLTSLGFAWQHPIKRPEEGARVGREFDERRHEKMPSPASLRALAKVFHLATDPCDVLVSAMAAILCAAPDRVNEVLTLRIDCETSQAVPSTNESAYGLRWWPSKGAEPMIKWVVNSMADVVQEAIHKTRRATDEARAVARWYEANPKKLFLPPDLEELRSHERLTMQEIGQAIFAKPVDRNVPRIWCKTYGVPIVTEGRRSTAAFADVEAAVIQMLPRGFPVADAGRGLLYSEALFVVRVNELHSTKTPYRCAIDLVEQGDVYQRLGARSETGVASIFDKFGLTEDDGSSIRLKSHQFRHYLNTLAQAGGLSQLDIAKWSGRRDVRQNRDYNHVSDRDVLALVREAEVAARPMFGPVAKAYRGSLIPRDEFDRLKLQSAHTTDYEYCVHDFTMLPCQQHMDCINCEEEVCIKGQDPEKEANIRQLQRETAHLLNIAKAATVEGDPGADRWVEHQQLTLARADQLCAILDDERVPAGAVIRLSNLEAPSRIENAVQRRLQQPVPHQRLPGPEGPASRQSPTRKAGEQ